MRVTLTGSRQSLEDATERFFAALESVAGEGQVFYMGPMTVVGDREGGVLGTLELYVRPRSSDGVRSVHIAFIGVPKRDRGKGRGRRLMEIVLDAADAVGLPVDLDVSPQKMSGDTKAPMSKANLRKFYEEFGFKKVRGLGPDYMQREVPRFATANSSQTDEVENALERLDKLINHLDFSLVQEGDDLSFRKPRAMGYHYTSRKNLKEIMEDGLGGKVSFEPHEFAFWLALPYIAPKDAASVLLDAERDAERAWSRGEPSQKTLDKLQALLDDVPELHVVWFYREPGHAGETAGRRETCVRFNLNDVGDWLSANAESVHEFTDHADGYAVSWIGPKIPPHFIEDCGEDF